MKYILPKTTLKSFASLKSPKLPLILSPKFKNHPYIHPPNRKLPLFSVFFRIFFVPFRSIGPFRDFSPFSSIFVLFVLSGPYLSFFVLFKFVVPFVLIRPFSSFFVRRGFFCLFQSLKAFCGFISSKIPTIFPKSPK